MTTRRQHDDSRAKPRRLRGILLLASVVIVACEMRNLSPGIDLPTLDGGSGGFPGTGGSSSTGGASSGGGPSGGGPTAGGAGGVAENGGEGGLGGDGGGASLDAFDFTSICAPGCSNACPCVDDADEEQVP